MRRTFRACLSIFKIRVAESFQYRASALSGIVTSYIWAVIEIACFMAFFKHGSTDGGGTGLTLAQTVSHVWVRELLLGLMTGSIDVEQLDKIKNGDIGIELCRPLEIYWHWLAKGSAGKVVVLVFRGLTCFLLGFLLPGGFGARLPASPEGFLLFLVAVVCAFMLSAAFVMFLTAIRASVSWGDGPMHMLSLASLILAGGYLPLQLWPDSIQKFLMYQPFAGTLDIPARLYIGSMPVSEAWLGISVQLVWTVLFVIAGKYLMGRHMHSVIVQGG